MGLKIKIEENKAKKHKANNLKFFRFLIPHSNFISPPILKIILQGP